MNRPGTQLETLIERYLTLKRSLGRGYTHEAYILSTLCRFLASSGRSNLDQESFEAWCRTLERLHPNGRRSRQRIARNLCLYRQRSEPNCFVPDENQFARPVPHAAPTIISPDGVARVLAAAPHLRRANHSPLRPQVMRLAVVLLYTAGLRCGELLRLTLADANHQTGTLHIREPKFHKSRTLPISSSANQELSDYLRHRHTSPFSTAPTAPLLCNKPSGERGYSVAGIHRNLTALFDIAHVRGHDGRRPRVHDYRHSFAVNALVRWYREGVDLHSKLPHLAMYMGHVSIVSTAHYLKLIPEVAELASDRFETHYGHLITGGAP